MKVLNLKSDDELNDMARDLGFDPKDVDEVDDPRNDHPMNVEGEGDVMRVMALVGHIDSEIEKEETALKDEIETVKEFRESRIERKRDTKDYLTLPLQRYIDQKGDNYNGPMGHAGFHAVTTTDWKATADELVDFAREHGLRQKVTIKAELTTAEAAALEDFIEKCDPEASVSTTAYKSAIKDYMRSNGLHNADYSESGEAVGGNPLYQMETRDDFRIKPDK